MNLKQILAGLEKIKAKGEIDREVTTIENNSKKVIRTLFQNLAQFTYLTPLYFIAISIKIHHFIINHTVNHI